LGDYVVKGGIYIKKSFVVVDSRADEDDDRARELGGREAQRKGGKVAKKYRNKSVFGLFSF